MSLDFFSTFYDLPRRLGDHWIAPQKIIKMAREDFVVCYDRAKFNSEIEALRHTIVSQDAFEWITYIPGVLGSRRVERGNLIKRRADKDILGDEGKTMCSICQEDVSIGDEVVQLEACKHWYHDLCIGPWLDEHAECPMCRRTMRSPK